MTLLRFGNKHWMITAMIVAVVSMAAVVLVFFRILSGSDSSNPRFVEEDRYEPGPREPTEKVELTVFEKTTVNHLLGFPDGNMLKAHQICYDESIDLGYGVGIMTSEIAIFENDVVTEYLETNMGRGDSTLKYLVCGNGLVFLSDGAQLLRIDGKARKLTKRVVFDDPLFANHLTYLPELHLVSLPDPNTSRILFFDDQTLALRGSIEASRSVVMTDGIDSFYVLDTVGNDQMYTLSQFDDAFGIIASRDLSVPKGSIVDAAVDTSRRRLWVLTTQELQIWNLNQNARPQTLSIPSDSVSVAVDGEYAVVLSENGYDGEERDNFQGGVRIYDAVEPKILTTIEMPHLHKDMNLVGEEETLFILNNNDNSATRLHLPTGETRVIDFGSSAEHGVVTSDGTLYVSNRLGGSTIVSIDVESEEIQEIETGGWPVGSAYSETLDRVFTFDMLASSMSVIDPSTKIVTDTYPLGIPDGNSDAIGDLTYDATRHVFYAAVPEQNLVVALDAQDGSIIERIHLPDRGVDVNDLAGAGELVVAVFEPTAKLFVYASSNDTVYVYDGLDDFRLADSFPAGARESIRSYPYALMVDQGEEILYVGNRAFDARLDHHPELETLSYGESVAAIDRGRGILLTVGYNRATQTETLYALNLEGQLIDSVELAGNQYVKGRFAYDADHGWLYAFFMTGGEIWGIQIFAF